MNKRSFIFAGIPLVLAIAFICLQEQRAARLEKQIVALQSQIIAVQANRQDGSRLENQLSDANENAAAKDRELMRLRIEKIALQKENAELKSASSNSTSLVERPRDKTQVPEHQAYHFTPEQRAFWTERLNFGKRLGQALRTLANENNGQFPQDPSLTAKWLSTNYDRIAGDTGPLYGVSVSSFELVYKGNLKNLPASDQVILAREVNPVEVHTGRWNRMYVFGDGSVQQLEATTATGFDQREQEVWPGQP